MSAVSIQSLIEEKLKLEFNPVHLEIDDMSSGCGAKFSVIIVSEKFEGKPLLQRHRSVNSCVAEEMKSIHALTLKTFTPKQWEEKKGQILESRSEDLKLISLPAASCKPNNASALFGPGPSFTGLTAVDLTYARASRGPPKNKEPRKIRRSNSDLAVRRKSVERRKSRDLNKDLPESTNTQVVNGGCRVNRLEKPLTPERSQSESSQDSTDQGLRYPLFIPVGAGPQAQTKPRGEKQAVAQKSSSPSGSKQSGSPGERINLPRRSASFTSPRKTSVSEGNSTPRGTGNQPKTREAFRREKSDIVKPGCGSAISKQNRSYSPAGLNNKNSGVVSPRSQLTASPRRGSASSSFGIRREKSDVRTRRARETPSPTNSPCHEVKGTDSSQSISYRSISNCSDTSSSSAMSKIPSLKRAPVVAGKAPAQISRIPSLTKQHAPTEHARNPPKSKIPSISKGDNKRSQIPSAAKHNQDAPTAKSSRIPSFSSPQGRPGSSKENQDPSVCDTSGSGQRQEEASDQSMTRIPSLSKKSRIPSLPRKDSGGIKLSETASSRDDVEDGLQTGEAERITNGGTDPSKVKKTSVSRIPSLTRASVPEEESKAKSNIPSPASALAAKVPSWSIPKPSGTQSPVAESPTGIPKPSRIQSPVILPASGIPTPSGQQPIGTQQSRPDDTKISSLPQAQSKLPQLSRKESTGIKPPSKLPSFSGATTSETAKERNAGAAKDASNASRLHLSNASVDNSQFPADKQDAEPTKTTQENEKGEETEDSPTHKRIANEAQKVEKLLREEHVVVEVPVEVQGENDEAEREEEKPGESTEKSELSIQDEKLISDVLESYAPDLADKENIPTLENKILVADKDGTKNPEGRLSFDDIYVQAFENEMAKAKPLEVKRAQLDICETTKPKKEENEGKKAEKTENEKTQTKKEAETRTLNDDKKSLNAEVQALDTLGGYEQQSRRTRSRQRKMVSDTEESENEQSTSKEEPKKNIDKDKSGTSPSDTEKKTKSKSKNEKSKFVVESSLGKEFYESRKTESKESISVLPTVNKPKETSVVIENKNTQEHAEISQDVETNEAVEFEDIELNSIEARREISRSVDELDEKTVKCMGCGRGGKCSIM